MTAVLGIEELREPLVELGRRWAVSQYRPRPLPHILDAWDELLNRWVNSSLPLVLRDSRRRGESIMCTNGRSLVFGDNTAANWALGLAIAGEVPDTSTWNTENIAHHIPLTFLTKGATAKRDLNKAGWKICHIDPEAL